MDRTVDVAVVGAGPAGLAAAAETGGSGVDTLLIDAGLTPGGQLVKQIHKFFGSGQHWAGMRGTDIAATLSSRALDSGVEMWMDSSVLSCSAGGELEVAQGTLKHAASPSRVKVRSVRASRVVLATGAEERAVAFRGWTLPGVMGAGAAQTLVNLHRVLPGKRVLVLGSGNVGLIVSYQLLQAGAEVPAVVEAAPTISGYGVHAAKLARMGVQFLTGHTVSEAHGTSAVEGATVVRLDGEGRPVRGTGQTFDIDCILVAAGLRPNIRLASVAGCRMVFQEALGGWMPVHDRAMRTPGHPLLVGGDLAGVEEASVAIDEGRLAGISAARSLGAVSRRDAGRRRAEIWDRLDQLRGGHLSARRHSAKREILEATYEG